MVLLKFNFNLLINKNNDNWMSSKFRIRILPPLESAIPVTFSEPRFYDISEDNDDSFIHLRRLL